MTFGARLTKSQISALLNLGKRCSFSNTDPTRCPEGQICWFLSFQQEPVHAGPCEACSFHFTDPQHDAPEMKCPVRHHPARHRQSAGREAGPVHDLALPPPGPEVLRPEESLDLPAARGHPDVCRPRGAWFFIRLTDILILASASPEVFLNRHTDANLMTLANKNSLSRIGFQWSLIIAADPKQ